MSKISYLLDFAKEQLQPGRVEKNIVYTIAAVEGGVAGGCLAIGDIGPAIGHGSMALCGLGIGFLYHNDHKNFEEAD